MMMTFQVGNPGMESDDNPTMLLETVESIIGRQEKQGCADGKAASSTARERASRARAAAVESKFGWLL
jgi:hypothetical protein